MSDRHGSPLLQERGRRLLALLHGALRALKLYPLENAVVQQALADVHGTLEGVLAEEGVVKLRVVGDFFFLNETRLRLGMRDFSTFAAFSRVLEAHGIGAVHLNPGVRPDEWAPFLSLLLRVPPAEDALGAFLDRLGAAPVSHIEVHPPSEDRDAEEDENRLHAAKRTWAQSVKVAKDVLGDVRLGRAVNVRKVKRTVQNIVDQVLADEPSMVTMTTLRDFDEYTFTHSVNVAIFSVVIGQRLGFDRAQLYELGLAGLLHDIGKLRIGADIINKPDRLTREEWLKIQQHPTEGLLVLFEMEGFTDTPYRQMLVAYEHHMGKELKGYPQNRRPRSPTLFSRIVAVADGFDAATSIRSYQYRPQPADEVLREMKENPRRGFDPLVVKALINATGVFPIGTLAVLDSMEMAVVSAVNPQRLHQPRVKVIADPMGVGVSPPRPVDLSEADPATGRPSRQIIRTLDPLRYGIRVADYLT